MTGLFAKPQAQAPATPTVSYAPPMTDVLGPSVQEAQNNNAVAAMNRAGRQSTILSKSSGPKSQASAAPAAQDAYSGLKLGAQ